MIEQKHNLLTERQIKLAEARNQRPSSWKRFLLPLFITGAFSASLLGCYVAKNNPETSRTDMDEGRNKKGSGYLSVQHGPTNITYFLDGRYNEMITKK